MGLRVYTLEEMHELLVSMPEEDEDQLFRWCLNRCAGNEADAEDRYQDTILAMLAQRYPWKEEVPMRAQLYWVLRRIVSALMKKPDTTRLTELFEAANIEEEYSDGSDPEKTLLLKDADHLYEAIRIKLPEDSYARTLWELMYAGNVSDIQEQIDSLGWPDDRVRTARKLIKERAAEVFKRFGMKFEKPRKARSK